MARYYIYHSELPEEKWAISLIEGLKESIINAWNRATETGLKWPGFEKDRLYLSEANKTLLADELRILSELDEL